MTTPRKSHLIGLVAGGTLLVALLAAIGVSVAADPLYRSPKDIDSWIDRAGAVLWAAPGFGSAGRGKAGWLAPQVERKAQYPTDTPVVSEPIRFWADDDVIQQGQCTTVHWSVYTHYRGVVYQDRTVDGAGDEQECPQTTTTYTLHVFLGAEEGDITRELTVTVISSPEIKFWADRYQVAKPGDCTTIRWSVGEGPSVYYQGQAVPNVGDRQECPQQTTIYTLRVVADMYDVETPQAEIRQVTVGVPPTVTPTPAIDFWADRVWIAQGQCATLHWNVGVKSRVSYQGQAVELAGNRQECPWQTTTFTLRVERGDRESLIRQVTVNVIPHTFTPVPTPSIVFWADHVRIVQGQCTTLHWRVDGAQAIYYQNQAVGGGGDQPECPRQTTVYVLHTVAASGEQARWVTVYVDIPTATPTSTFTPTPTPTPTSTHTPTPTPTWTPTPTPTYTPTPTPTPMLLRNFSGSVYTGEYGDRRRPLPGVRVEVYGAHGAYPDPGRLIDEETTSADGSYSLWVLDGFKYYALRLSLAEDGRGVGVRTVGGTPRGRDWIEYAAPLESAVLSGNDFWAEGSEQSILRPLVWGALGVLVLGGGGLLAYSAFSQPPRGGKPKGRPPLVPLIPPVRLINVWLSEGRSGSGRRLANREALTAGAFYNLHLQIQPRQIKREGEKPAAEAGEGEEARLRAVVFAPESDFRLKRKPQTLDLPRRGASNEVQYTVQPLRPGRHQIRICVYYGNVLLQSAVVQASVVEPGARASGGISRRIDYVASARLVDLDELRQPDLSIWANQTPAGTHWIGVFSASDAAPFRLLSNRLYTLDPQDLPLWNVKLRERLAALEGRKEYLEEDLINLADLGRALYHRLFKAGVDYEEREQVAQLERALLQSGIVSIAQVQAGHSAVPWAALYTLPLDRGLLQQGGVTLCPAFKGLLGERIDPAQRLNWLQHPESCRSRDDCPLSDPAQARLTVCPFGFWGFLHQIEQPLHRVQSTWIENVPDEIKQPGFNRTFRIEYPPGTDVRLGACVGPDLDNTDAHRRELQSLAGRLHMQLDWKETRQEVMDLLEKGDYQLLYFYCHGEVDESEFKLVMRGPLNAPIYLTASEFDEIDLRARPLVILNACESMAPSPDVLNHLMETLQSVGASGVVGTEVEVRTVLAHVVGYLAVEHLLQGKSLGEALLEVRRALLGQQNPQGLLYTCYAPAALHLHQTKDCAWCKAHPPAG